MDILKFGLSMFGSPFSVYGMYILESNFFQFSLFFLCIYSLVVHSQTILKIKSISMRTHLVIINLGIIAN